MKKKITKLGSNIILCQPSSAAVERERDFSILKSKSSFDTDQNQALEDSHAM